MWQLYKRSTFKKVPLLQKFDHSHIQSILSHNPSSIWPLICFLTPFLTPTPLSLLKRDLSIIVKFIKILKHVSVAHFSYCWIMLFFYGYTILCLFGHKMMILRLFLVWGYYEMCYFPEGLIFFLLFSHSFLQVG